jgi:hypothetical protein
MMLTGQTDYLLLWKLIQFSAVDRQKAKCQSHDTAGLLLKCPSGEIICGFPQHGQTNAKVDPHKEHKSILANNLLISLHQLSCDRLHTES